MIHFFVKGIPKAMSVGGKSVRNPKTGATFATRRNEEWGLLVGQVGRTYAPSSPLEGPVSLVVWFWVPRPTSASRKVVDPLKRPDMDNLMHKLADQFNGVFWMDDAQLVDQVTRRRFCVDGCSPGVEIFVIPGRLSMLLAGAEGIVVQDDD